MLAAHTAGGDSQTATDGLPVPPAVLRLRVAGTGDFNWFLSGGAQACTGIRDALSRHGAVPERLNGMLDFGCGCGRVTRRWNGMSGVHGCDLSVEAIAWCRANLSFAAFATNGVAPPLPYADGSFDFVYALSVFTHFAHGQQCVWMRELHRVLRPAGLLLITVHGTAYEDHLSPSEKTRYTAGNLVVRWEGMAGSNLCSAFHPEAYLRGTFANGFELLEYGPNAAPGNQPQDLVLFRNSTPLEHSGAGSERERRLLVT